MRQLALEAPAPFLENTVKGAYLTFVRGAKFYNDRAADRTAMQSRCLVELFGLDLSVSYQIGFVYIRQLALHLRTAVGSTPARSFYLVALGRLFFFAHFTRVATFHRQK